MSTKTLAGPTRERLLTQVAKGVRVNAASSSFPAGQPMRHAKRRMFMVSGALLLAVAAHTSVAAAAPGGDPSTVPQANAEAVVQPSGTERRVASSRTTRLPAVSPLDRRIALLVRELDLDRTQQLKVKAVLEGQREQILRVWQDESLPGALRVARTQAISERTEDGIRALLTEAQRQKYMKPRTDRAATGGTSDDLATYVDQMNRR